MPRIKWVLELLGLAGGNLRKYEAAVLSSARELISQDARSRMEWQIGDIERIQRIVNDKEVDLYSKSSGAVELVRLFASSISEWPMAMIFCELPHCPSPVRVTVWVVDGRVFSMIFSQSPTASGECRIIGSELLYDPTIETGGASVPTILNTEIESWGLNSAVSQIDISTIRPPLQFRLQERFILPGGHCIPHDYRELMQRTNGFRIGTWRIAGLPLREVAMEDSNLFLLAESTEPQILCAMDSDRSRNTYLWNLEENQGISLGPRFIAALIDRL